MNYDLSIYGHLTIDHIFDDFNESITLGAIANVWSALVKLDSNLSVKISPTAIGEAMVLVNKRKGFRVGRGNLNLKTSTPLVAKSRWHHIMYLNRLKDLTFMDKIEDGIITADLTAGEMDIEPYLSKLDYLLISDEDLFMDIDELGKLVKGWAILHYPAGSYVTDGETSFQTNTKIVNGIDVLGAGDMFAASFIHKSLTTQDTLEEAVLYAHQTTTQLLVDRSKGTK